MTTVIFAVCLSAVTMMIKINIEEINSVFCDADTYVKVLVQKHCFLITNLNFAHRAEHSPPRYPWQKTATDEQLLKSSDPSRLYLHSKHSLKPLKVIKTRVPMDQFQKVL